MRNDKLFWQRRKQCSVSSVSREHEDNGFKVSAKLCLNLCSLKWLKPKRNLLSNLTQMSHKFHMFHFQEVL